MKSEIMYKKLILLIVSMFVTNIGNASNHDNVVDPHKNGPYYRPALQIITKYGEMDSVSKKVIKAVVQQELKQGLEVNPERVRNLAVGRGYEFRGYGAKNFLTQCRRNLKLILGDDLSSPNSAQQTVPAPQASSPLQLRAIAPKPHNAESLLGKRTALEERRLIDLLNIRTSMAILNLHSSSQDISFFDEDPELSVLSLRKRSKPNSYLF